MLENYCEKQGWEVVQSIRTMATRAEHGAPRPERMLKAIERRQINLVVTKDLSRLGRNYLQTGFLIEDFFPRHGVRYIAMNDGIDTMRDNNDIAPFKNILNEMYSKDISRRFILLSAESAERPVYRLPCPLRLPERPEDKNHLLIDEKRLPLSGVWLRGRWKDTAPTTSGAGWKKKKIPARPTGTGYGGLRNVSTSGKRKTR